MGHATDRRGFFAASAGGAAMALPPAAFAQGARIKVAGLHASPMEDAGTRAGTRLLKVLVDSAEPT